MNFISLDPAMKEICLISSTEKTCQTQQSFKLQTTHYIVHSHAVCSCKAHEHRSEKLAEV